MKILISLTNKSLQLAFRKIIMNKNTIQLCLCIVFLTASSLSFAEKVNKVFTKEIQVSNDVRINISGPESIRVNGNGRMHSRQLEGRFVVSGKSSEPHIYVINKNFKINTWDKNSIKQQVSLTLDKKDSIGKRNLLADLAIILEENHIGEVDVNFNLNIDQFKIRNSFFKADKNSIVLNNQKEYTITYLELESELYIPINSHVNIESDSSLITLGKHKGSLDLQMNHGGINTDSINLIKGNFNSAKVKIGQLNKANIQLKNSLFTVEDSKDMDLNSSMSTVHINNSKNLKINNSVNDKIQIEDVKNLRVNKSLFSSYQIGEVHHSLFMQQKNSDVLINKLNKNADSFLIKNNNANMTLPFKNLANNQSLKSKDGHTLFTNSKEQSQDKAKINIDCNKCKITLK